MIVADVISANGDLIHIKYYKNREMFYYFPPWRPLKGSSLRPYFRRAICKASMTEDAAYAQTNSKDQCVHTSQACECYIERNFDRHLECDCCDGNDRIVDHSENLNFALSASCSQLHDLANATLYSKNTFSFDDASSFKHFLAALGPNQKRMIRSLHLSRPAILLRYDVIDSNRVAWWEALRPSSIRLLEGLRTVHLCLDMDTPMLRYRYGETKHWSRDLQDDLKPFLQLRILPLTKVTVIITDDVPPPPFKSIPGQWSVAKKRKWAESTRRKLLEPYVEGAEDDVEMHDSTT